MLSRHETKIHVIFVGEFATICQYMINKYCVKLRKCMHSATYATLTYTSIWNKLGGIMWLMFQYVTHSESYHNCCVVYITYLNEYMMDMAHHSMYIL